MDLIQKFFKGKVIYLESYSINDDTIIIRVCRAEPEESEILGILIYTGLTNFHEEEFDEQEEEGYLEDIIDIIDCNKIITFTTDMREITFRYKTFEFQKPAYPTN